MVLGLRGWPFGHPFFILTDLLLKKGMNFIFLHMGCCGRKPVDKLKSIANGWRNIIWPNPETEKIAYERAEICAGCRYNKANWCGLCHCYIPAKARSLTETCQYWDEIDKKYDFKQSL